MRGPIQPVFLVALLLTTCSCGRDDSKPIDDTAGASLHAERLDLLVTVQKGMTEAEIRDILGEPDEVRIKGETGIVAEKHRWVYGTEHAGEIPRVGAVIFDDKDTVFLVRSPTSEISFFDAERLTPFSEEPDTAADGTYCEIGEVFYHEKYYGFPYIEVSIVNAGEQLFRYRHDSQGIRFSVVVDIHDEDKTLLLREPLFGYHSPVAFDRATWPVLEIPPGSRKTEEVPVWWNSHDDGSLFPGTYYIRVYFPLDDQNYYGSNLIRWDLKTRIGPD